MGTEAADFDLQSLYGNDWSRIFFQVAREKYAHLGDAMDLVEDARQLLAIRIGDQRARYPDKDLSRAYVLTAFRNALVEVIRQRHGYPRPGAWLKAQGELGELLFGLRCLRRLDLGDIQQAVRTRYAGAESPPDTSRVAALVSEMERRGECARKVRREVSLEAERNAGADALPDRHSDHSRPDARAETVELDRILGILVNGTASFRTRDMPALAAKVAGIRDRLGPEAMLDADEALALRGFYLHDLSYAVIGQSLGGLNERQVRYLCKKALEKLRQLLDAAGVSLADLLAD